MGVEDTILVIGLVAALVLAGDILRKKWRESRERRWHVIKSAARDMRDER